jgi:hypothetical protein
MHPNETDIDDEDNDSKYNSKFVLIVTFCVGCLIIIFLIILVMFVLILIVGAERINNSVTQSSTFINETLPLIGTLHDDTLNTINETLNINAIHLNNTIYDMYINHLAYDITTNLNSSFRNNITAILRDISSVTSQSQSALLLGSSLFEFETKLASAINSSSWNSLILNLNNLLQICGNVVGTNSSLEENCNDLIVNSSHYIPRVEALDTLNITRLVHSLKCVVNDITSSMIEADIHNFYDYLNDTAANITHMSLGLSHLYIAPLINHFRSISVHIEDRYDGITYGLPSSQQTIEQYLGYGYVSNWKEFQYFCTIAFSLALMVFVVGVVVALGRGFINLISMRMYGIDRSYVKGVHQSSLMLRNLTLWVFAIGGVSAFFFIFVLSIANLLGQTCGNHRNFTELMNEVIDNSTTWGNLYPLGLVYHRQPSYPLTISSVLSSCSHNATVIGALQLESVTQLDSISPANLSFILEKFIDSMGKIPDSFPVYSILGSGLSSALYKYSNLEWAHLPLPDLFPPSFFGLTSLNQLILDLNSSLMDIPENISTSFEQTLNEIDSTLPYVIDIAHQYDTVRYDINTNSSSLHSILEAAANTIPTLLSDTNDYQRTLQSSIYFIIRHMALSNSANITQLMKTFISQSQHNLLCTTGLCYPLTQKFANFSVSTCDNLQAGLDMYWLSLSVIFLVSLSLWILMLILASLFFNKRHSQSYKGLHFSLTDQILSQFIGILWLTISLLCDGWLLIVIATDTTLDCPPCFWAPAALFLLLVAPLVTVLRLYQWIIIHRIRVYRGVKVQQLHRYWLARQDAVTFYIHLSLFFILYIPFLGIAGGYSTTKGILNINSFFSLLLSLFGIIWFIYLLVDKRKHLIEYMNLLQQEIKRCCCCCFYRGKFEPVSTPMGREVTSRGMPQLNGMVQDEVMIEEESVIQSHLTSNGINNNAHVMVRLSQVIEEDEEQQSSINDNIDEGVVRGETTPPQILTVPVEYMDHYNNGNYPITITEAEEGMLSPPPPPEDDVSKIPTISLDRPDINFVRDGRDAAHLTEVEVAQSDTISTPRSSIYTSNDSVYNYHSTSHIPGYTTDDSSHRDGYDSANDSEYSGAYYGDIRVEV